MLLVTIVRQCHETRHNSVDLFRMFCLLLFLSVHVTNVSSEHTLLICVCKKNKELKP